MRAKAIRVFFDGAVCDACKHRDGCPARRLKDGTRVLNTTEHKAALAARRVYEEMEEFAERYAERAGIEATNSELKRRHGLGHIRTRRLPRIRLAVYLKAVACNVKRMVNYIVKTALGMDSATELALAGA